MKFYSVHHGASLDNQDRILGHYRKLEDAKKVFNNKVERLRSDLGFEFEEEQPSEFDIIFWYVDTYDKERTDDWESVWITEEQLQ